MKLHHVLRHGAAAFAFCAVSFPSLAAVAVAVGDGNYSHTLTEATDVKQAEKEALEKCAERADNCEVLISAPGPTTVALAKGDNGTSAVTDPNPEVARRKAMENCNKNYRHCRFVSLTWEPGMPWYARSQARDDKGTLMYDYFVADYSSSENAERDALKGCRDGQQAAGRSEPCVVASGTGAAAFLFGKAMSADGKVATPFTYFRMGSRANATKQALVELRQAYPGMSYKFEDGTENPGPQPEPKNFKAVAAKLEKPRQAARPTRVVSNNIQNITCTNQCTNGSCLRTFPNGRTERWQAPRVFDPLTNDWKWDTNSCGR